MKAAIFLFFVFASVFNIVKQRYLLVELNSGRNGKYSTIVKPKQLDPKGETISRFTDIPQRVCSVSDDSPCGHNNAAMGRPKRCTLQQEGGGDHLITQTACIQKCRDWNNSDLRNRLGGRLPCVAVETNAAGFPEVGICTLIKAQGFPEGKPDCPVMFDVEPSSNEAYSAADICRIRYPSVQNFNCHRVFPSGGNEECPAAVYCT